MTDDTNWLKRNTMGNPFRMSLRRSSRFYAQDMDDSIMNNMEKPGEIDLKVPHMPRRSKMPPEKIKEMNFKIPAALTRKIVKSSKPNAGFPRSSMYQNSNPRASTYLRPDLRASTSTSQDRSLFQKSARPSMMPRPRVNSRLTSGVLGNFSQKKVVSSVNSVASNSQAPEDTSLLSRSAVVDQSTPNDPTCLRSILKEKHDVNTILNGKKPRAAKRVNFNSGATTSSAEEKSEIIREGWLLSPSTENRRKTFAIVGKKKDRMRETDDETTTTTTFASDFKPLPVDRECSSLDGNAFDEAETADENKGPTVTPLSLTDHNFNSVLNLWKTYRGKANDIFSRIRSLDEIFQASASFETDHNGTGIKDQFTVYEAEKVKLYGLLKSVEVEFRDGMNSVTAFNSKFKNYLQRKEEIFRERVELDEEFEKMLTDQMNAYEGRRAGAEGGWASPDRSARKSVTRNCSRKAKTGKIGRDSGPNWNKKRNSAGGAPNTPDNTPAKRKKLSRKVEKQIEALLEE